MRVVELAFEPGRILDEVGVPVLEIVPKGERAALEAVADEEVGEAELVFADLQPETEQSVQEDAVVGDEIGEIGPQFEIGVDRGLLRDAAIAPFVAERGGGDHADAARVAEIGAGAHGDAAREVRGRPVGLLQQDAVRIAELGQDRLAVDAGIADARTAVEEALQRRNDVAAAIVEAEPVILRAVIGVALGEGGLLVPADPCGQRDEAFVGDRLGRQIDDAAAEFAGEIRGIGLLHQAGGDDIGRKDVERDDAAQRLGRGQREAVQERQRIAIAEPADIDEAVAHGRKPGHAAQGAGDVAFARSCDGLGGEDRDNLRGIALGFDPAAPGHDDEIAAGNRNFGRLVDLGVDLRILADARGGVGQDIVVLRFGRFALRDAAGRAASALRESEGRAGQRRSEKQQPGQLLAGGHAEGHG